MFIKIRYIFILFSISLPLFLTVCAGPPERTPEEKNEKMYGLTKSFRNQWWDYYERGLSFADGGFWEKAELDLRDAIRKRNEDQRRARTYGRHFIDYFPHRELGVVLYEQGKTEEAIRELELSLKMETSAKAECYIDKARKSLMEQKQQDFSPPEITLLSPAQPFLTNAFSVLIQGIAKDYRQFVRHISVGGKSVRIDVSEREIPFRVKVPLIPGVNRIPISAANLAGRTSETVAVVTVDCAGPMVSIDKVDTVSENNVFVKGYASDDSGIAELLINGETFPVEGSPFELEFQKTVTFQKELTLAVTDVAGNVTVVKTDNVSDKEISSNLLASNKNPLFLSDAQNDCLPASSPFVKIELNKREAGLNKSEIEWTTYLDQAVIDGVICSDKAGTELIVRSGEKEIFRLKKSPRKTYHFSCISLLNEGENLIKMTAVSPSRHTDGLTVKIHRKIPAVESPQARLKLALKDFEVEKTETVRERLSTGFENRLSAGMIGHEPRRFWCVEKLNLNQNTDNETARKEAKRQGFDLILFGKIEERTNSMEKNSVIISTRIESTRTEDSEPSDIIVKDTDVFGEDADRDNIHEMLKALAERMKLKLIDELPVIKGKIEEKPKKDEIIVDFGEEEKIRQGMELIVYEQSTDGDSKLLGEAKIKSVKEKNFHAHVTKPKNTAKIQQGHLVITK